MEKLLRALDMGNSVVLNRLISQFSLIFVIATMVLVRFQWLLGQTFYIPWFTTIFFKDQMSGSE